MKVLIKRFIDGKTWFEFNGNYLNLKIYKK